MLYTDRSRRASRRLARRWDRAPQRDVASGLHLTVDDVADAALRELAPRAGTTTTSRSSSIGDRMQPLVIDRVVTADRLSDIRHQLASWLQSAAVPDEQVADIVLSVNEACANSIEHGYRERKPGKVRIDGENDGARVHLKVTTLARGTGGHRPRYAWTRASADSRGERLAGDGLHAVGTRWI